MYATLVPLHERLEAILTPGERAGDERFVVHAARTSMCEGVSLLRWPSSTCGACARGASCGPCDASCASCDEKHDGRDACDAWRPSRAGPGWPTASTRPGQRAGCESSW